MKICAISPMKSATCDEILSFISQCKHNLIVLPGRAANHPSLSQLAVALQNDQQVFVESGFPSKGNCVPWLVTNQRTKKIAMQVFAQKPSAKNLDDFQELWSDRTYEMKGMKVFFALCGEIDGFKTTGEFKRRRIGPDFDILVNPTHTLRGHWNYLGQKLQALSAGRIAIHVSNNTKNHHKITTDVRIYANGQILKKHIHGKIAWSESNT